jgi:hypothetical protein
MIILDLDMFFSKKEAEGFKGLGCEEVFGMKGRVYGFSLNLKP